MKKTNHRPLGFCAFYRAKRSGVTIIALHKSFTMPPEEWYLANYPRSYLAFDNYWHARAYYLKHKKI